MTGDRPPLAMTMGDPAGIGPELALAAWRATGARRRAVLRPRRARRILSQLARARRLRGADHRNGAWPAPPRVIGPRPAGRSARKPGRTLSRADPTPRNAAATIESIARAVRSVRDGAARAVVTNPIAKASLYEAGFRLPGPHRISGRARQGLGRRRPFRS